MRIASSPYRLIVGLLFSSLLGCGPGEEIRSYEASKPKPIESATLGGPDKSRVLGAIIPTPSGEHSWFVKFRGTIDAVTPHEKEFQDFVKSIRVDGESLKWTAPPGWTEKPAKAMRVVTLVPPNATPDSPELYVSVPFGGSLLENVNRWRKEVGAKEITAADLPTATTEVMLGDVKAYTMDARGPKDASNNMMPPFMQK